jgi:hypothetical protein
MQSLALGAQRMHAWFMGKAKTTKAPGRNVTESERGTERLTLRLKPSVMNQLMSLATEIGEGDPRKHLAKTIEQALAALNREMNAEVEGGLDE